MLEKELEADETSSNSENEPDEDGKDDFFFDSVFVDKRSCKGSAAKIAASFLDEPPTKNILAIFAT